MKILWIVNILLPEAKRLLTGKGDLKASGGWLLGAANALVQKDDIQLVVATVYDGTTTLKKLDGKSIVYYLIPKGKGYEKYNPEYNRYWKEINEIEKPDIVHIHGTEFSHGLSYIKACGSKNVVVSIQGLISEIGKHYCDGLSRWDIYKNITLHDLLKGTCYAEQSRWIKRGEYEKEIISSVNHIIGRTEWDKAHTWAINPKASYHHCNETLREEFYIGQWEYAKCRPHSIFVSSASYPVKGFHQLLKALPLILKQFPDTMVHVAGADVTKYSARHFTGYFKYLRMLIREQNLFEHIEFCGALSSEEMKQEYLNSNVFICPSTIENSSNSLGEAQILGVPCVASFVGGTPDMMLGNNLYRFDDVDMLAKKVCEVFNRSFNETNMIEVAKQRHNQNINAEQLFFIYNSVI